MTNSTPSTTAKSVRFFAFTLTLFLASQSFINAQCPGAFISEIGYDCIGADMNEAVEVCIPNTFTGNLADLSIELYNGSNGTMYDNSMTLDNFSAGTNDGTNTYYSMAISGIQNGAPDGLALIFQGAVCEFLSYEGDFIATSGAANGEMSTDIGAAQSNNTTDCNSTLQLCNGTWMEAPMTLGAPCAPTVCGVSNVTVTADGACSGDDATYTVCADVASGSGDYDLVDTNNANAVLASLTGQADGNICFTVTVGGPTTAGTLSVDVLDNADATCIGGTPAVVTIPACPITTCTITNVIVTSNGACSGDDVVYTVCADVASGSGSYDLIDFADPSTPLASLTGQADGNICFSVTVPGPTVAFTFDVDVADNADPTCISGDPATVILPQCPVVGADVYISEISYNPCTGQGNDTDCEYIVITNAGSTPADISGYSISNAFSYIFPAGTIIPAGGTLSLGISANCAAFTFDLSGSWTGNLNNTSETLELNDASGAMVFMATYSDATGADGDCDVICSDPAGTTVACSSSLGSGGTCPDLTAAAPPVVITDSTCPSGNAASGGVIDMPTAACPAGSTLEYSEDGTTWSGTLPIYLQNGPVQTIMTRCICDTDMSMISPASSVMTSPGSCADCGASISTFPANGN